MSYHTLPAMNALPISTLQKLRDILCLTDFVIDYTRKIICIATAIYKPWQDKKRS